MLGIAVPLILAFIPLFVKRPKSVAIFAFMGALIAVYVFLGVGSDGNLTVAAGTGTNTILAASSGSSSWTAAVVVPGSIAVIDSVMAISRAFF